MKPAMLKVNMAKFNELTLRKWSFIRKKNKRIDDFFIAKKTMRGRCVRGCVRRGKDVDVVCEKRKEGKSKEKSILLYFLSILFTCSL